MTCFWDFTELQELLLNLLSFLLFSSFSLASAAFFGRSFLVLVRWKLFFFGKGGAGVVLEMCAIFSSCFGLWGLASALIFLSLFTRWSWFHCWCFYFGGWGLFSFPTRNCWDGCSGSRRFFQRVGCWRFIKQLKDSLWGKVINMVQHPCFKAKG